jgi:hypothetical protein
MDNIHIITDDADRKRHQANADRFYADHRNALPYKAFCDAIADEDVTDDEIIDLLVLEFGTDRINVINRLAEIDFVAAREACGVPA